MRVNFKSQLQVFIFLIFASVMFSSCQNEDSPIGLGILPGSDKIELFCDTIDVKCITVSDMNIATDERSLASLGSFFDPVFGFSKASFICQTRISSNNVDFSVVETINSIELHLKYSFHYGDSSTNQNVKIYRLLNDVFIDSVYYAHYKPEPSSLEPLIAVELNVPKTDSIVKIQLPISLAQEFKDADLANFVDNEAFIKYFKGLYVTTEDVTGGGCIYNFNLYDSDSRMIMNYNDSLSYEFYINSKSACINMFEHDYSSATPEIQALVADSTVVGDFCYLQSLGGLRTKLFFPELQTLFDSSNIAINKARLILNLDGGYDEEVFLAPPKTTLVSILESGKYDFLTDYKVNSPNFGGEKKSDNSYSFNIPFYIQELVNGNTDYGLYLFAIENRTKPYRAIINNKPDDSKSIKLEIYYSKY
ncbi:MAG: DUF4270 family protein [Bacteroidales bacterium]|nr:DUF4270 family protein [Bacteroidales bacterium]MDY0141004.1 DUF4270 family protein [Bacteroidales bacterium]